MKNAINHLVLSWSVSRGRDTYGYNICRLDDSNNGQRFRAMGGGYDIVGTVFANWLDDNYQAELLTLKDRANYSRFVKGGYTPANREDSLYGMAYLEKENRISLDGACGLECILKIANEIGLEVEEDRITEGKKRGQLLGFYVQMKSE